jgi:hypothetical protein
MLTDSQSSPHAYAYVEEARKLIKKIGSVGCIYIGIDAARLSLLGMWTSFITINHNCVDEERIRDEERCGRM